jgi:hypothetical protein
MSCLPSRHTFIDAPVPFPARGRQELDNGELAALECSM